MQSLKNLFDKLCFSALLLIGIQIPNYMAQYQQILKAHFNESSTQLLKYQAVANQFYAGDINQLLDAHNNNPVSAIKAEATIIEQLVQRHEYLHQQINLFNNRQISEQLWYLIKNLDYEISIEVVNNYSINLPLNTQAITVGLGVAFSLYIALHLILSILLQLLGSNSRRSNALHRY